MQAVVDNVGSSPPESMKHRGTVSEVTLCIFIVYFYWIETSLLWIMLDFNIQQNFTQSSSFLLFSRLGRSPQLNQ